MSRHRAEIDGLARKIAAEWSSIVGPGGPELGFEDLSAGDEKAPRNLGELLNDSGLEPDLIKRWNLRGEDPQIRSSSSPWNVERRRTNPTANPPTDGGAEMLIAENCETRFWTGSRLGPLHSEHSEGAEPNSSPGIVGRLLARMRHARTDAARIAAIEAMKPLHMLPAMKDAIPYLVLACFNRRTRIPALELLERIRLHEWEEYSVWERVKELGSPETEGWVENLIHEMPA